MENILRNHPNTFGGKSLSKAKEFIEGRKDYQLCGILILKGMGLNVKGSLLDIQRVKFSEGFEEKEAHKYPYIQVEVIEN